MLDWFKRTAALFPAKQSVENGNSKTLSKDKVEQLVGRLEIHNEIVKEAAIGFRERGIESENQLLPTEAKLETLASRLGSLRMAPNEVARRSSETLIIAVASQKGGVGKTTIAAHLAVQASMVDRRPTVLVDTDPQGSLTAWWDARYDELGARSDEALTLAKIKLDDLAANNLVGLHRHAAAVAIIDTPPALTASIEHVIAIADLVIVPARPSPHDLRAVGATVGMMQRAQKPFLFVVNGASPRANITAEAVAALSEHGRVAPVILYQRTNYAASMIDGRTVIETAASSRSAQEIGQLWKYVTEQIAIRAAA